MKRRVPAVRGRGPRSAALLLALVACAPGEPDPFVTNLVQLPQLPSDAPVRASDELVAALDAYGRREFAVAASSLGEIVAVQPDSAEAWLYLGSSLLLQHRWADAEEALLAAVASFPAGQVGRLEEARFLLAQARLGRGDAAGARKLLEELGRGAGRRAEDARGQLQGLRRSDPR